MRPIWNRLKSKDKEKDNKPKGNLLIKFKKWMSALVLFFKGILPIVVAICLAYVLISRTMDMYQSKNNPEYIYDILGKEDLNELIAVAGNEEDGYYLAYKKGLDEKLDQIVEKYKRIGYYNVDKEILLKMIQAELITQYPDLGGKIGHEADIEIGASFSGGLMNIKEIFQTKQTTCGPTAAAMVLSYLTNSTITEDDVYNWCTQEQFGKKYFNGNGSNMELFAAAAEHWGVGPVTRTKDSNLVRQGLLSGKPVIAYVHSGHGNLFTNGQHFIVLSGIDEEGKVHVLNSNPNKSRGAFDLDKEVDVVTYEYFIFDYGAKLYGNTLHWPTIATANEENGFITSYFGPREQPLPGASTDHGAIDIAVPEGTEVYACAAGKVITAEDAGNAGNFVEIDHGNGYVSGYMHNSVIKVSVGDQVQAGQVIALSGNTGNSTGPHLHFQIKKDGTKVDPLSFKYDNGMGDGTENSIGQSSVTSLDGFLFIGDSITEAMQEYNVADDEVTFKAKIGIGSKYWLDNFDSLTEKSDIKGINVLLGANDYDYATDYMKQLLDKLHEKYPNITIYVDKLLPDLSSSVDSTKREKYISDIKSYCEGKSYLVFIDPTSNVNMIDGDCHPATENDYKTLWNNIKNEIMKNGSTSSEDNVPPLLIGEDTGEGMEGFQGAIRIRRVTPNKEIGELKNTGVGDVVSGGTEEVVTVSGDGLGKKEEIPEDIKKKMEGVSMRHLSGTTYDDLSYLTIPYYDFNGNVKQGHMVVNAKLADEVLLIFQELYKIKYPIERMEIIDNFTGSNGYVGDSLDYASIEANNTSAFNDRQVITPDGSGSGFSRHAYGQAIDINPQINPYIRSDRTSAHSNAQKYNTNRDTKEGWSSVEKAACITKDSAIYKIFTKYGWTWLGNDDNTGDTQHFEKTDLTNVKTIDYEKIESENNSTEDNDNNEDDNNNNEEDVDSNSGTEDTEAVLQNEIKDYIDNSVTSGEWSVYAKNLKTNSVKVNINDKKMQSASLIKLFIMATAYQKMAEGVTVNNAEALIQKMITVSDNNSTNTLIRQLGMDTINQYISSNGYSKTELHREMLASTENGDNYTSVSDVAKILERIYKGECVNEETSEKMLNYLKAQTRTKKIPAGVPDGVVTANKTGELSNVENDAAIVFKENEPYILVVMSSGLSNTSAAVGNIVEISKKVYEQIGSSGDVEGIYTDSGDGVSSAVSSKVYDLKYIPESEFNKKLDEEDPTILQYYTLDGNWKLITANWSYSSEDGIKYSKNTPINYKSALKKYITPMEYLMDYYIDIKEEDFINDFADLIFNSEFIIAVQDNVTTTQTTIDTSITYDDGEAGESSSEVKINETVTTAVEVTYVDTWFVKFSKKSSYSSAALKSSGGGLTGKAGDLVGEYKTTSYCYICNDDGSGNFGTSVTASGATATPHRTVAIHNASTGGDPNGLKLGDKIMIEGDPTVYVIEDTGSGQPGAWIDVYVEATGSNRGNCCINSEYADRTVKVYLAEDIQEVSQDNLNDDNTQKYMNTIASVLAKVTENINTRSTWEAGPNKRLYERDTHQYFYIGSTKTITTSEHSISVKYETGDSEVSSNEEKFLKLFKDNPKALNRLKGKWLISMISGNSRTSAFTDLTKYLLYKLLGHSYGVTKFDFSIYEPGEFTSMNSINGGREQFIRWLHEWEGINGSISADGTKYIIGDDGFGHPTVGYGIDIFNGGFADRFRAAGYSTDVGAEVDKEFVDNLEKEEIDKAIETVEAKCAGLNLTQYQKYALVSRIFNCGAAGAFTTRNGKDFVAAYTAYWNSDTDDEYKVPANESMFSHQLYTTYMYAPNTSNGQYVEGLNKRRRAEWLLFKTGYYDRIDEYYEEGGNIEEVCQQITQMLIDRNARYGAYTYNDIEKTYQSDPGVVCASYVALVLYKSGLMTAEQLNAFNYHYTVDFPNMLRAAGWKEVDKSDLQPGDVLNKPGDGNAGHVVIYVGNGLIYDQTSAVISSGGAAPTGKPKSVSGYIGSGYVAWRAP